MLRVGTLTARLCPKSSGLHSLWSPVIQATLGAWWIVCKDGIENGETVLAFSQGGCWWFQEAYEGNDEALHCFTACGSSHWWGVTRRIPHWRPTQPRWKPHIKTKLNMFLGGQNRMSGIQANSTLDTGQKHGRAGTKNISKPSKPKAPACWTQQPGGPWLRGKGPMSPSSRLIQPLCTRFNHWFWGSFVDFDWPSLCIILVAP